MWAVSTRDRSGGRELAPLAGVPVLAMAVAVGLVLLALSWRAGLTGGELATLVD
ncbi:MAG: hypothetical protein JWQ60_3438, partial [Pseudonocardia sp.]|nr:hypothetical protein [Pseudonocardia sp.]